MLQHSAATLQTYNIATKISTFSCDKSICDRICEKVPFPHILHASKQNVIAVGFLHCLSYSLHHNSAR